MTSHKLSSPPHVRFYDVHSADGTTVLLSDGLGSNPYAWPSLLHQDCGVRVVSWLHRGVGASERPKSGRADLDSNIEDALAARHSERVDGILAVAGVPGDTFSTMLAPAIKRIPWTNLTAGAVQRIGFISRAADTDQLRTMLREFCTTNPRWYAHLALGVAQGSRVRLSGIRVPVTFIAAKNDMLTGARDMKTASQRIPDSKYVELRGTHFLPIEQPEIVRDELLALIDKVEAHKKSAKTKVAENS